MERTGDPTTDQLRHRRHLTAANCGPNRGPVASSAASGYGAKETDPMGYRSQTRWLAFSHPLSPVALLITFHIAMSDFYIIQI